MWNFFHVMNQTWPYMNIHLSSWISSEFALHMTRFSFDWLVVTCHIRQGVETKDPSHFITEHNIERLRQAKEANRVQVPSKLLCPLVQFWRVALGTLPRFGIRLACWDWFTSYLVRDSDKSMAYARVFAGTYKCIQIQPFVQFLSLNVQQIRNHVCSDRCNSIAWF